MGVNKRKVSAKELALKLANNYNHLSVEECELAIKVVLNGIAGGIERGERTEIRGFGTFTPVIYKPGTKRNPRTGDTISTGYRGRVSFKPGKELKNYVL
ncbi:integration host factor subunit beta [Vibrio parahaemolyticus]|uniref:HU family DNA-binding protein n=1 Tax=Vibrio TaxID=662 RepID=UPI001A8E2AC7|nr:MULTISPECIES: HU family DNA-binding protein [Vibrio]EGQ7973470.1 integration host factor subunit beta [Vibrio parahaemolyticus]MBO0208628.1 integration host factor subunit beta [Vibrio sp. Vb0877]MCR9810909.1 integration host factor subunit beta [Vibrio parahaemolyticus]MDW2322717.1 HU family DNA-binding protein [Vibrio sp. 1159]